MDNTYVVLVGVTAFRNGEIHLGRNEFHKMASSVFFKFKSQKEPTRVEFDGTGISVFELKREIINKSGLGDGTDFDLFIYTDDNSEGMLPQYLGALQQMSILTVLKNTMMTPPSFRGQPPSLLDDSQP